MLTVFRECSNARKGYGHGGHANHYEDVQKLSGLDAKSSTKYLLRGRAHQQWRGSLLSETKVAANTASDGFPMCRTRLRLLLDVLRPQYES